MGAAINHRRAAGDIGRGKGLAAAKFEAATKQLVHHQTTHRAVNIRHLGLATAIASTTAIAISDQVAVADRDRAVF